MITRVSPSALLDLRPARRPTDPAGPVNGVQGHRTPCAAARGCRAAPRPSRPRLDWADRVGLDYSIWLACGLGSSLGDLLGCLPARALPARLPGGAGLA